MLEVSSPAREAFTSCVQCGDDELRLDEAALWIAAETNPDLSVDTYLKRLDAMAEGARAFVGDHTMGGPTAHIAAFHTYFFRDLAFHGNADDYYDPRNSFLNEVLDRRIGIPITLSLVYIEIARRLSWPVEGVSFPGHFLVRWDVDDGVVIVDVFNRRTLSGDDCAELLSRVTGGEVEFSPELLTGTPVRSIIVRILNNLRAIWARAGDCEKAITACDRILIADPTATNVLRDRGALWRQLECYRPAAADFRSYLDAIPDAHDADIVAEQLSELETLAARIS